MKRYSREKEARVAVNRTLLVAKYDIEMGRVDGMNHNIPKYWTAMKLKTWYSPWFTCFLDASVNNALQLYNLKDGNIQHFFFSEVYCSGVPQELRMEALPWKCRQSPLRHQAVLTALTILLSLNANGQGALTTTRKQPLGEKSAMWMCK